MNDKPPLTFGQVIRFFLMGLILAGMFAGFLFVVLIRLRSDLPYRTTIIVGAGLVGGFLVAAVNARGDGKK